MYANELISPLIPEVKTSDTGNKVLSWMEFFKVSHMPIVNNEDLLGLISESDIYNLNCGEEPIGNHKLSLIRPYVIEYQHIWEVVDLAAKLKLSIIPVLSATSKKYLGAITLPDLVQHFAKITCADERGTVLVLEMGLHDYVLSEIARIAEENDTKIVSLYVSGTKDSMKIYVTIKFDTADINPIIHSFNRYDYNIKASFMINDDVNSLYRDRYELFLSYLNV
ncbi:MAG: CBS domain-containing protein [Bacteroidales bacterium]